MRIETKVLLLEHDPNDIGLLQYELKKSDLNCNTQIVRTKQEYESTLSHFKPDIILSDYSLPSFDGLTAFKIKETCCPATPFIIVSGTLGEERAVELIKIGVTDYVLKDKMFHIAPKIHRALKEAEDRKQKEFAVQQLKEREEQLQKILDLSLDVICTIDEEGKFVTVGGASRDVWGYAPEELIGKNATDFIHPDDIEPSAKLLADLLSGVGSTNYESRFVSKSGVPVTMFWSGKWDPNEKILYSIARDATEIKKAEAELKAREKRFRTILQNSSDGYLLLAADGKVIDKSPSLYNVFGLTEKDLGDNLRTDLVHPEDLPNALQVLKYVMSSPGEARIEEFRFLANDGSYRWIETTIHNQLLEPAVRAVILNSRNITERKSAEIAIEKSEEKYRNLFNLSPIPMWLYDTETFQFLDVNQAAIKHFGYTKKEFLSMTLQNISTMQDKMKVESRLRAAAKKGGYKMSSAMLLKKNGEVVHAEIHGNAIETSGRKARMVVATDISERARYIQAIEEQNVVLREIAWTQSHIVRAPIARIMGLANLLQRYDHNESDTGEILTFIQNSAHELDSIIREIVQKTEKVKDSPILKNEF